MSKHPRYRNVSLCRIFYGSVVKKRVKNLEALPAGRQAWKTRLPARQEFSALKTVFMRSIEKHKKHLRKRLLFFVLFLEKQKKNKSK